MSLKDRHIAAIRKKAKHRTGEFPVGTIAFYAFNMIAQGHMTPVKYLIKAAELEAWCAGKGKSNDAQARSQFAAAMAMARNKLN